MKTLQDLYAEVMGDEKLKEEFVEAAKADTYEEFLAVHGCDATFEELQEFLTAKAAEDDPIELSMDELKGCHSTNSMIAVSSSGEIMPCNQMSGCLMEYGMSFGNVRETPLKDLLSDGFYVDVASMTAGDLRASGGKCGTCPYFEFCAGGCRALGVLLTGERDSFLHEDLSKCAFFENGWYQKVVQALPGWTNLSEIPII